MPAKKVAKKSTRTKRATATKKSGTSKNSGTAKQAGTATKAAAKKRSSAKAPWTHKAPPGSKHTTLTPEQKAWARAQAKKAGRRYPNLVDNMRAAQRG